jgi:predicted dehydrogenase
MTVEQAKGFEIVKVWDEHQDAAQMFSKVFYGKPEVCRRFEDVSDEVDLVFIADCNGDGSDHLTLAKPGLMKGVPTFVDKPFAYTVKDAKEMLKLSGKYGAPVMSSSILYMLPEAIAFGKQLQTIDPVEFGSVKGFGGSLAGIIHGVSLAQRVFGGGVKSVECMGQTECAHILLNYGGKEDRPKAGVVVSNDSGGTWHASMYAHAYSSKGETHSARINDFTFPQGAKAILEAIKTMVRTGKTLIPHQIMLEGIAIAEVARIAQKRRRPVLLSEAL